MFQFPVSNKILKTLKRSLMFERVHMYAIILSYQWHKSSSDDNNIVYCDYFEDILGVQQKSLT